MQKSTFSTMRVSFPLLSFFLITFILLVFSCKDGDKKTSDNASVSGLTDTTSIDFKMNCVILTKAQIQTWVDSGWTKPGTTGQVKELLLQFFSPAANSINANMQLIAYPGENYTSVKITGKQELHIDTSCVGKNISGPVVFANNSIKLDALKILNPDGTLNDFDFIRLIPQQDYSSYINFSIEIVRNGEALKIEGGGSNPCPPYCCPPYCGG